LSATLEQPRTDAPDAPPPEAPEAPARLCASCAAPLAEGQDWCLECGTAQPGRLGGRPGWRPALTVLALTGLLATGAAAAAYAALSSEAQREAAAPPPPAAAPQVAQPPVQTAPPAETTPKVEAPKSDAADVPKADLPADDGADAPAPADDDATASPAPSTGGDDSSSSGGGGTGSGGSDTGSGSGTGTGSDTGSDTGSSDDGTALDLSADAAGTYDPEGRGQGQVGDPADAVDGRASTAWQAPVADDGQVRIGLVLSLEEAQTLSKLEVTADTPGFSFEVYGTRSTELPPDVLDGRWEHVTDRSDAGVTENVSLSDRYRHVLVWFTAQPADTIVRIPDVRLFG
jgi:hypothetical protein